MSPDAESFTAFVSGRWSRMVRTARLVGCDSHEAEDMAQSALVACYVNWRKLQGADNPDAYAYKVLINTINSAKRRKSASEIPGIDESYASEVAPEPGTAGPMIQSALRRLEPTLRSVIVLRYFADFSERDTAVILHIPPGTVKSRLSRALQVLSRDASLAAIREEG